MRHIATMMKIGSLFALAAMMISTAVTPAAAQGTKIVVSVNEDIITNVDVEQRAKLIMFASGGRAKTPEKLALRALIDDSLKLQEAKRLKVSIKPAMVDKAIATIAKRNRISADQLLGAMRKAGVDPDTFKFQIRAELAWNRIIRGRYGARLNPTEGEIEAAMGSAVSGNDVYELKQIVIALEKGAPKDKVEKAAARAAKARKAMTSCDKVAELAPKYSKLSGNVGKVKLSRMPPPIRSQVTPLPVGGVTPPIRSNNGLHLIIVCDIKRVGGANRKRVAAKLRQAKGVRIAKTYLQDLRRNALITRTE
ncbi:MAG: SurA N-terminal domain-containing protein [Neomegalonema sp.]|nr:SurA N-terminal domain-containing protein [Neomegalonema sp.]